MITVTKVIQFEDASDQQKENVVRLLANHVDYPDLAFIVSDLHDNSDAEHLYNVMVGQYTTIFNCVVPGQNEPEKFTRRILSRMCSLLKQPASTDTTDKLRVLRSIAKHVGIKFHEPDTGDLFVGLGTTMTPLGTWNPYEVEEHAQQLRASLLIGFNFTYHNTDGYNESNPYAFHGAEAVVLSCLGHDLDEVKYLLPEPTGLGPKQIDPDKVARAIRYATVKLPPIPMPAILINGVPHFTETQMSTHASEVFKCVTEYLDFYKKALPIPKTGERYKHHNGNEYEVVIMSNLDSQRPEYPPTVVYKGDNGKVWSKTLADFNAKMTRVENEKA